MYNYTNGAEKWKSALTKFIAKQGEVFYPEEKGGVMIEPCEYLDLCNADQESFKAYLARWLGTTIQLAPFTYDLIMPKLQKSAVRAAQTCTGASHHGGGDYQCGMRWFVDGYDNSKNGVGQQMSALNVISVLNAARVPPPYSHDNGGTSQGDPGLGNKDDAAVLPIYEDDITTGDRAGAAIITMLASVFCVGGAWWLVKN
jgi:hypothetical protein